MRRILIPLLLAVAANACDRATEAVEPEFEPASASLAVAQVSEDPTPDQLAVAQVVPGFGGYYLDNGAPTVNLTDPSQRPAAEQALATGPVPAPRRYGP